MSAINTTEPMPAGRSKFKRADRDVMTQIRLLKDTVARNEGELADFLPGRSAVKPATLRPGQCMLFREDSLAARLESAKKGGERLLESELKKAQKLGPVRELTRPPNALALDELGRDFPHFEAVVDLMRQRTALAAVTPGEVYSLPPILLSGAAGVGKTAFGEAVARCMEVPIRRVDMAATTAGFVLGGSHSSWSSARPGTVWELLQSPSAAGLMLVDELDKVADSRYPPCGPLYRLLEISSARAFQDEYVEIEVDASNIMWIATCNEPSQIEPALRSRFTEFLIEAPNGDQMCAIADSVYANRRTHSAWGKAFPPVLDRGVAMHLTTCTPRELSGLIEAAAAHAASCGRTHIEVEDIQSARKARTRSQSRPSRIGFI